MIKRFVKDIWNTFLDEFSSVKLALVLFAALAITTLIGTILPEEPMVGTRELIEQYGMKKYNLMKGLGLTDVFHSWWYLALLTMLGINLIVASFKRVFPKAYLAFSWPVELNEDKIKKLPINNEFCFKGDRNILDLIKSVLNKKKYKTKISEGKLVAVKGSWHRLGASVTHVGIIILLIGSAISILTGFNGMVQLGEKEGFYIADLGQGASQMRSPEDGNWIAPIVRMPVWFGKTPPYLIKVNSTWKETYENGAPKQWYSDLSILDDDKNELLRKKIHVNNPLQFKGLDIYQSNWGSFIDIAFNGEKTSLSTENIKGEELVFLPLSQDIALKFKVDKLNDGLLKVSSILREKDNSGVEKYIGTLKKGERVQLGPLDIQYFGFNTITGLQFKSNPGDSIIYLSIIFIFIGVFIAFGSKKQIWASFDPGNNKLVIGGSADRAKGEFYKEFEGIVQELSEHAVNVDTSEPMFV